MQLYRVIKNWFNRTFNFRKGTYKLLIVDGLDKNKMQHRTLYLEVRGEKERWLHFKCPDLCGENISLNLMKSIKPYWTINIKNKNLTAEPSIWRQTGCHSHFYIRESQIIWV